MITTVCKISYGSQTVPPIVPAVQGDTGRAISFEIADFTPPAGATATYFILKPSGEAIYNSATITDNSILCELTAQSLAEAGENRMQVRVLQGEDIVTSFEVILMVRTFLGDDAMESGTEMNIFDKAVEQATEQFQENAEQIVEEVIESIPADYTELTEEVDELNERLDDKVDIQQELEDVGKVLVVGSDGKLDLSSVFSLRVRTAFANIFQHVAYTDSEAEEYYDELINALAGGEKYLASISATYVSSGHTVYPWDTLDSLKTYLTVTALYSDGTSQTVLDYTLSGTLDSASSVITVGYLNKTTQVTINVTIDSALMYYAPSGYVLDGGASSGFDTGVKLSDTNKAVTIVFDVTDEAILTRVRNLFLFTDRDPFNTFATYQFNMISSQSENVFLKKYQAIAVRSMVSASSNLPNSVHHIKAAIIHEANASTALLYMNIDNSVAYDFSTMYGEYYTSEQTLFIGTRPDGGYQWKGTINLFSIFSRALTVSEVKELLGVA